MLDGKFYLDEEKSLNNVNCYQSVWQIYKQVTQILL